MHRRGEGGGYPDGDKSEVSNKMGYIALDETIESEGVEEEVEGTVLWGWSDEVSVFYVVSLPVFVCLFFLKTSFLLLTLLSQSL